MKSIPEPISETYDISKANIIGHAYKAPKRVRSI